MARATMTPCPLLFTSNTAWLEEVDARRAKGPEELLTTLEDLLDTGELTLDEVLEILNPTT